MGLFLPKRKLLHLLQAALLFAAVLAAAKLLGVGKIIEGEAKRNVEPHRDPVEQGFNGGGGNSFDVTEQQKRSRDMAEIDKSSEWVRKENEVNTFSYQMTLANE